MGASCPLLEAKVENENQIINCYTTVGKVAQEGHLEVVCSWQEASQDSYATTSCDTSYVLRRTKLQVWCLQHTAFSETSKSCTSSDQVLPEPARTVPSH